MDFTWTSPSYAPKPLTNAQSQHVILATEEGLTQFLGRQVVVERE